MDKRPNWLHVCQVAFSDARPFHLFISNFGVFTAGLVAYLIRLSSVDATWYHVRQRNDFVVLCFAFDYVTLFSASFIVLCFNVLMLKWERTKVLSFWKLPERSSFKLEKWMFTNRDLCISTYRSLSRNNSILDFPCVDATQNRKRKGKVFFLCKDRYQRASFSSVPY